MPTFRSLFIASTAAAAATALTPAAVGAAGAPVPVVKLKASVAASHRPITRGTRLTLTLDTTFASVPAGGNFVLQHVEYLFGAGARSNGKLFPSCSVARLDAAHGTLGACPKGSKIGSGVGTGTAVALGITASGRLTAFNGPGGRSFTMNFSIERPAVINTTFSLPVVKLHGRYMFKVSAAVPDSLQAVLGGDIVVKRIKLTTGATRTIGGVKRGYFEADHCPAHGSAIQGNFVFNQGATASADTTVVC